MPVPYEPTLTLTEKIIGWVKKQFNKPKLELIALDVNDKNPVLEIEAKEKNGPGEYYLSFSLGVRSNHAIEASKIRILLKVPIEIASIQMTSPTQTTATYNVYQFTVQHPIIKGLNSVGMPPFVQFRIDKPKQSKYKIAWEIYLDEAKFQGDLTIGIISDV